MQTIQRGFAETILSNSMAKNGRQRFRAVKEFMKREPTVAKFKAMTVEHYDLPLEIVNGERIVFVACKATGVSKIPSYSFGLEKVKVWS